MTGPCAKTTVTCTIVTSDGEKIVGTNYCENPQEVCPREPGEGYEKCASVCRQAGHAEQVAVRLADDKANGARAFIEGHTYACQACQEALYGAGVLSISVLPMKGDTMTKTDTSREAFAEWFCKNYPGPDTIIHDPHWHAPKIFRAATHALLTERDALQARAERAEALRAAATEVVKLLWEGMSKQEDIGPHGGYIYMKLRAALAKLDAEPAGVSEPAGVKVKPLVWEDHPSDNKPALAKAVTSFGTYFICDDTDDFSGVYLQFVSHDRAKWWQHVRSTCETIVENYHDDDLEPLKAAAQADYEQRILAALEPGQTHREVWEQCKEAAAKAAREMADLHGPNGSETAIRAMKYPGDSQ